MEDIQPTLDVTAVEGLNALQKRIDVSCDIAQAVSVDGVLLSVQSSTPRTGPGRSRFARKAAVASATPSWQDSRPTDSRGRRFREMRPGKRKPRFAGLSWAGQDSNLRSSDYELR
ncbi:MAG: hypothetical protein WB462_10375, partial [Solirubrobacterales bacterium]